MAKRKNAANHRTESDRQHHKLELSKMVFDSVPVYVAAKEIGVSVATAYSDYRELLEEWKSESLDNIDKLKTIELKKLDALESAAWDAWERSGGRKVKTRTTQKMGGVTVENLEWEETGNPKYLQVINQCMNQRAQILGLYKTQKVSDMMQAVVTEDQAKEEIERQKKILRDNGFEIIEPGK